MTGKYHDIRFDNLKINGKTVKKVKSDAKGDFEVF